jgi:hypothetical protein
MAGLPGSGRSLLTERNVVHLTRNSRATRRFSADRLLNVIAASLSVRHTRQT